MTPAEIIDNLTRRGFALIAEGSGFRVSPGWALTPDDLALIRQHRSELVDLVRQMHLLEEPIVWSIVPASSLFPDRSQAGPLQWQPRWQQGRAEKTEPTKRQTTPPLASLAHLAIGDHTPPEHWAAIGGSAVVKPLDAGAEFRLWAAQHLYQRDGPAGPWQDEYRRFWITFTTGDTP